ncbi:MAG: tetraacyldisaccharide 4'-kinase [Bdellovibrionia bacterium]
MSELWLGTLAKLYAGAAGIKNYLYDHNYFTQVKMKQPVISVGNLTVGGTGKTPFTHFLIQRLKNQQFSVAVISRAYKGQVQSPEKVDRAHAYGARYYGDEPFLLAQKNPQVDFFVGQSKSEIAEYISSLPQSYDFIIVDDGFQHRKLHRNLDIVLLDATEDFGSYRPLPLGRAREPWTEISRAQFIVITKANLVEPQKLDHLMAQLPQGKPVMVADYEVSDILNENFLTHQRADLQKEEVWLLSAIARPRVFEKMMAQKYAIKGHSVFRDHHQYSMQELQEVFDKAHQHGVKVLMTEKDAVKVGNFKELKFEFLIAPLDFKARSGVEELDAIIRNLAHD